MLPTIGQSAPSYDIHLSKCANCVNSYFNLTDGPTIEGMEVVLGTDQHLPVDSVDIPLGNVEKYPDVQANQPFILGAKEPDIDHCFIMDANPRDIPVDTRSRSLSTLAALSHKGTGLHLEIYSTEPAFQFYTGRHISVPASEHGPERIARAGLCVEPSRYIDAINRPEWRNMSILKQGEKYGSHTRYIAWRE